MTDIAGVVWLLVMLALSPRRVVGHSDVAPDRKSDPGIAFDWPLLHTLVHLELEAGPQ